MVAVRGLEGSQPGGFEQVSSRRGREEWFG